MDFFRRRKAQEALEIVREKSDLETLSYCTQRLLEMRPRWNTFSVRKALKQNILMAAQSVEQLLTWTEQCSTTIENKGYPSDAWKRQPFEEREVVLDDFLIVNKTTPNIEQLLGQLLPLQLKIVEYLESEEPEYKNKRNYYLRTYRNLLIDQLHLTEAFIEHFQ